MENALLHKLQIKSGFIIKVLNAPEDLSLITGEFPNDVHFAGNEFPTFDALLIFALTKATLLSALANEKISTKTLCWILYPKAKSKLASDLNLMQNWEELKSFGLTPCGSAAIDETWTALRIKPATELKRSGVGNAEIAKSAFGNYIDVSNKIVTLPEELSIALQQNPPALSFYETLSYSNRKEYVLWILTAKQDKTRIERISKMLTQLATGKKNPAEK